MKRSAYLFREFEYLPYRGCALL
eukprot:UN15108